MPKLVLHGGLPVVRGAEEAAGATGEADPTTDLATVVATIEGVAAAAAAVTAVTADVVVTTTTTTTTTIVIATADTDIIVAAQVATAVAATDVAAAESVVMLAAAAAAAAAAVRPSNRNRDSLPVCRRATASWLLPVDFNLPSY